MKKNKRNIICAWVLLLCFVTGQYMVYAHQHYKQVSVISASKAGTQVKERCDVCDAMHHTHMLLTHHVYFAPAIAVIFHYQYKKADVKIIQLVLASGRAPPVIS